MGFLCCCFFVVFFNLYAFLCGGDPLEIGDVSYLCAPIKMKQTMYQSLKTVMGYLVTVNQS